MKSKLILLLLFHLTLYRGQQLEWIDTIQWGGNARCRDVTIDSQGNILITGCCANGNPSGYGGFYVHKYSPSGNILWQDTGSIYVYCSDAAGIEVDNSDNAYLSTANYFIKYNSLGQRVWSVTAPQSIDIKKDNAGLFYLSSNNVYKYDSLGICTSTVSPMYTGYIALDSQNNLFIRANDTKKFNSSGIFIWTYPGTGGNTKMDADNLGNCYFTDQGMYSVSSLKKVLGTGQLAWTYTVPFWGGSAIQCSGAYVYVAGQYGVGNTAQGISLNKFDSSGNVLWSYQIPTTIVPAALDVKGGVVYLGGTQGLYGQSYLMKITEPEIPTFISAKKSELKFWTHPNPSSGYVNISFDRTESTSVSIKVTDAVGKIIYAKSRNDFIGMLNESIDLTNYPKGVYILEIGNEKFTNRSKLVIE